MKYRKDITDYLIEFDLSFKDKDFNVYELNNLLYKAEYDYNNKITHFTSYDLLWSDKSKKIKEKIEKKFNVKFIVKDNSNIVCKCGEFNSFSAMYGSYELLLKCNVCNNTFSAYSG